MSTTRNVLPTIAKLRECTGGNRFSDIVQISSVVAGSNICTGEFAVPTSHFSGRYSASGYASPQRSPFALEQGTLDPRRLVRKRAIQVRGRPIELAKRCVELRVRGERVRVPIDELALRDR